jgi:hypothetical protein
MPHRFLYPRHEMHTTVQWRARSGCEQAVPAWTCEGGGQPSSTLLRRRILAIKFGCDSQPKVMSKFW